MVDGWCWFLAHKQVGLVDVAAMEDGTTHYLVYHPKDLSNVLVALLLRASIVVIKRIEAEDIEPHSIGHNILALHHAALLRGIIFLIERVIGTQILVKTYAYGAVAYDDALVESANLRIDNRHAHTRNELAELLKGVAELFVYIVHARILHLHIGNERLKDGVLIEPQKLVVYVGIIDLTQLQHVLNKGACLHGVVNIHLLKS